MRAVNHFQGIYWVLTSLMQASNPCGESSEVEEISGKRLNGVTSTSFGFGAFLPPFSLEGCHGTARKRTGPRGQEANRRVAKCLNTLRRTYELNRDWGWLLPTCDIFWLWCSLWYFPSYFVSSKVSELQRLGLSEVVFLVFEGRGSWDEINSHWTTCVETNINIYIYMYIHIYYMYIIYVLVYVHIHFVIYTCLRSLQKPSRVNQVM